MTSDILAFGATMCGDIKELKDFFTKEEEIEILEGYIKKLEEKARCIEEAISELRRNN